MGKSLTKYYCFNGLAGCVQQRKAQETGTLVGVYNAEQSGMEEDSTCKWLTVCEEHHNNVGHLTLKLALHHAVNPKGWCGACDESE